MGMILENILAIEDDLKTIEKLQNDFKNQYGSFFEMDWQQHHIAIPRQGDHLQLTKIKKLNKLSNSKNIDPEISFIPTEKDWRFCIGKGVKKNKNGETVSECWHCLATQKSEDDKILTVKIISGGDSEMLKTDGIME